MSGSASQVFITDRELPSRQFVITPSDTIAIPEGPCMVYCNGAGTVTVRDTKNVPGTELSYTVVAGDILPLLCSIVMTTGTSATPLYGLKGG